MFKKIIKNIIYFCLNYLLFLKPYSNKATILMYHSVGENNLFFNVESKEFIRQIEYLKRKKFNIISLSQLVEWIEKKQVIPKKTVVLTFDDGYQNNHSNVWPILKEYDFPVTIFLAVDLIDQKIGDSQKIVLDMLNWPQIQEMDQSGLIDFQPHTLTHSELSQINPMEAKREIEESKRIVQEKLNKKCNFFAYPRGNFNQEVVDILKESGFKAGLTIKSGLVSENVDLFKLPRQSINSKTNFEEFKTKLKFNLNI